MDKRIRPSRKKTGDVNEAKSGTPETDEVDLLDQEEQGRVEEKLSISVPVAPLPKRAKPFWGRFLGQKVLLQLRDGAQVTGILRELLWDYVRLENVSEIGRNYRLTSAWLVIDTASVARIYPADADVEHTG